MLLGKWKYAMLAVPLALVLGVAGVSLAKRADKPDLLTVPEGTPLVVRLDQSVSTRYSRPGGSFDAHVISPVVVQDKVVIPAGTPVEGRVVYAKDSGRLRGRAHLALTLVAMDLDQQSYELRTNTIGRSSGNHKVRNIAWIGGGGGTGALIGALAAGGKGALIGGPVGAGAGLGIAALTGKKHTAVPAETALTFHLRESLSLPPSQTSGRSGSKS